MPSGVVDAVVEAFGAELSAPCGRDDSFFALGGDSLSAARVLARLNERFAVRIPFSEMYRDSTPSAVAGLIEALRVTSSTPRRSVAALARRCRGEWLPLALNQHGLYRMNAATGGAGLFNNVGILRFTGDIDPERLKAAVADTVLRQSALRLVFGEERGEPVQRVVADLPVVDECDLRGKGEGGLARLVRRERLVGFDLHTGPPTRFTLASVAGDAWVLVATFHHIVTDGMSQSLFVDDLARAYAHRFGAGRPLHPLRWDYTDFAEWQRDILQGERLAGHLDAIAETLGRTPAPRLAGAGPAEMRSTFLCRAQPFAVAPAHAAGLRRLAAGCETTLFVTLAAAVFDFIARRTGAARPAIAIQASNRTMEGTEEMVGCFANSVPVAIDHPVPGAPALGRPEMPIALVHSARAAIGEALRHQEVPLEHALALLADRGDGGPGPEHLPQVGFTLQPPRQERREVPGGVLDAGYPSPSGDTVDPTAFSLVLELFDDEGAQGVSGRERHLGGVTHHRLAEWGEAAFTEAAFELRASLERLAAYRPLAPAEANA